jgi:hypothetical protein
MKRRSVPNEPGASPGRKAQEGRRQRQVFESVVGEAVQTAERAGRKIGCGNANRDVGESLSAVETEQVIRWKRRKTASREKSLEGRNAQEGKGQTPLVEA